MVKGAKVKTFVVPNDRGFIGGSEYRHQNFYGYDEIVIPKGIAHISHHAFADSKGTFTVSMSDDVGEIDARAFEFSDLKGIKLSNSCSVIGEDCFAGCVNLKSVVLPKSLHTISLRAFYNCMALESIEFPDGLQSIGNRAFSGSGLTSVILPDSVTQLHLGAFMYCEKLEYVKLSDSLETIGESCFRSCYSLKEVILPSNLLSISSSTFKDCSSLEKVDIPNKVKFIDYGAFMGCKKLSNVTIPNSVERIEESAFAFCDSLNEIEIPESVRDVRASAFIGCVFTKMKFNNPHITNSEFLNNCNNVSGDSFGFIYLSNDGKDVYITKNQDPELEKVCRRFDYSYNLASNLLDRNYRQNYEYVNKLKEEKKIAFIPQDYILKTIPHSEIQNFFVNKNHFAWRKLVQTAGFDKLNSNEKYNTLTDLFKIYYAIGGFSENQGERDLALEYAIKYIIAPDRPTYNVSLEGSEIHEHFSELELSGKYNKTFAQFFMKYYKDNHDFMTFDFGDEWSVEWRDYLCQAHNNFQDILDRYPNHVVNGNEERSLLTPKFVADHCMYVKYKNIEDGNEALADLIGHYGYTQNQFEKIQGIYNNAKKLKDKYVIMADKADEKNPVTFRVLEKDDPLGFVLGNITNCCQHISGAGGACVDDGYTNPNAGFLVFEESVLGVDGKPTGDKRILGQAYVWYDEQTKTVCYDNIEIPTKVLQDLRYGDKHSKKLNTQAFIDAVEKSADSIKANMERRGYEVRQVTTGEGYNDIKNELSKKYTKLKDNLPTNRSYHGYTDANKAQFVIRNYAGGGEANEINSFIL